MENNNQFSRVVYWNNELPYPYGPYTIYNFKRELAKFVFDNRLQNIWFYITIDLLEGKTF